MPFAITPTGIAMAVGACRPTMPFVVRRSGATVEGKNAMSGNALRIDDRMLAGPSRGRAL
jgi:succinyl-CoA synthetase beta subunit